MAESEEELKSLLMKMKEESEKAGLKQCRRPGFNSWVRKIPQRRKWQPTPVFLPGESLWTEEPGGLQSMGVTRVGHHLVPKLPPKYKRDRESF